MLADALAYAVGDARPRGDRRRRDPDRCHQGRARPAGRRAVRERRRAGRRAGRRPAGRPASRCGGSRWPRPTRRSSARRSPTPTTPAVVRARSPPPCSCSTSSATSLGAPRHRVGRRRARGVVRVDRPGPTGFGARGCCCSGWARRPADGSAGRATRSRVSTPSSPAAGRRRHGSSTGTSPSCSVTSRPRSADRGRLLVALGRVGHPVVPQRVVEGHHAAGPQQPQRLAQAGGVLRACRRRRRRCRSGRRSAGGARRAPRRRSCAPAGSGCRPR